MIRNPAPAAMTITKRTHVNFLPVIRIHVLKLSRNPVIEQTGRDLWRSLVQPHGSVKASLRTIPGCSRLWTVKF